MFKSLRKTFGVDAPVVLSSTILLIFGLFIGLFTDPASAQVRTDYRASGFQTTSAQSVNSNVNRAAAYTQRDTIRCEKTVVITTNSWVKPQSNRRGQSFPAGVTSTASSNGKCNE